MERVIRSLAELNGLEDIALFLNQKPICCVFHKDTYRESSYCLPEKEAIYHNHHVISLTSTRRDPKIGLVRVDFCQKFKTLEIKDLVGWGMVVSVADICEVDFIEWGYDEEEKVFHSVKLESVDGTLIILGAQLIIKTYSVNKIDKTCGNDNIRE